ncbi:complement C1q-like protein 2 [Engraulis encrasicolus]|uniref:complement C1q-like protein 2 n=1 Tax=Engraulis encrasicolus TaxID=184585 RepID=UPI002FCEC98F
MIAEQREEFRSLEARLRASEKMVEELRRERDESRVSFSASLVSTGSVTFGPYSGPQPTLVYNHIFSNIGNAYNPHTGIFTAPVRGIYHFVFFVFGDGSSSTSTAVSLNKNGQHVALAYAHQPSHQMTPSNGVSLLLEVDDVVYIKAWGNSWVRDSYNHHSTFSGHLLFLM